MNIRLVRCADRTEGWVVPSRQKGKHITGGLVISSGVRARKKAGLPEDSSGGKSGSAITSRLPRDPPNWPSLKVRISHLEHE